MVFKTLCWIKFQPAQKFPCNQDLFQFRRPILCAFRRLSENTASDLYWPRIQTFHIKTSYYRQSSMWPLEFDESPLVDNEDRIQPTILKWRSQGAEFCKVRTKNQEHS